MKNLISNIEELENEMNQVGSRKQVQIGTVRKFKHKESHCPKREGQQGTSAKEISAQIAQDINVDEQEWLEMQESIMRDLEEWFMEESPYHAEEY